MTFQDKARKMIQGCASAVVSRPEDFDIILNEKGLDQALAALTTAHKEAVIEELENVYTNLVRLNIAGPAKWDVADRIAEWKGQAK